ncbi:MAG: RNA degradosome polyphosphate kinase [Roseivirga sp.]
MTTITPRLASRIEQSDLISRDLSWLKFNHRVLDQARKEERTLLEQLKFMAITASNLDEFFMIRIGSLFNYLDYSKERYDYSGLREIPFKNLLMAECHDFIQTQHQVFVNELRPQFAEADIEIERNIDNLSVEEEKKVRTYFKRIIYPMLTPMVFDSHHSFPILMNKILIFAVVTRIPGDRKRSNRKFSFVQIPQNLERFYELERAEQMVFVPIEEIIRKYIQKLFRNVEIVACNLFRITRNGDFTLEESEDIESGFLEEIKQKLKKRKTGRVVRMEAEEGFDKSTLKLLKARWELGEENIFPVENTGMIDYTGLWQIINHTNLSDLLPPMQAPVMPLSYPERTEDMSIFDILKERDVLLHHPYNDIEPLLELIEKSSEDPKVLSIKLTIYRLAKNSRITSALLKAAENGKHVSVLFEVKARFDEENNLREAAKLQKAGCFVIYGISSVKTHTKLLLVVRREGKKVTRYVHMSSGNYNEKTARLYTDLGLLSTDETYAQDVSEFFNVITGHSLPHDYKYLITAPGDMRQQLIDLIRKEAVNASEGLQSGIMIKINSLQDKEIIEELYAASQAGVPIKLIVRGICCLRPGRAGLSENIEVISIVGDYLEHSRIYYYHNNGDPLVYGGSADVMVRSFDRRIESLFLVNDDFCKQQCINLLRYNLRDNTNAYIMQEDGSYQLKESEGEEPFNVHK